MPLDYTPSNAWRSAGDSNARGVSVDSGCARRRQNEPLRRQQRLNALADPHGHGSWRPSFSTSSLSRWTMRSPRLTCVSDGKPRRRLRVTSKADVAVLDRFHDVLLASWSPRSESNGHALRRRFLRPVRLPDSATRGWIAGASPGARTLTVRGKSPVPCRWSSRRIVGACAGGWPAGVEPASAESRSAALPFERRPHPSALVCLVSAAGLEPAAS